MKANSGVADDRRWLRRPQASHAAHGDDGDRESANTDPSLNGAMNTIGRRLGAPGRYLLSGGLNTALTYALYLALLTVIEYRAAFSIAFVFGICCSYVLNRSFVFRTGGGVSTLALMSLVYVIQYIVTAAVVVSWTEVLGLPAALGLLPAIVIAVPITFVLLRWVFVGRHAGRRLGPGGQR
jgi:putative flippase GtrA